MAAELICHRRNHPIGIEWRRVIHVGIVAMLGAALPACEGDRVVTSDPTEDEFIEALKASDVTEEEFNIEAARTGEPRPPVDLVEEVEARLRDEDCVGDLRRWERLYSYDFDNRTRSVDTSVIPFLLREAGVHGFEAGRKITEPLAWVNLDDRSYDLVRGRYVVPDRRLEIEHCGPNVARGSSSDREGATIQ